MTVESAYEALYTGLMILLAAAGVLCLIRAVIGPRIADRVVSVNMIGTQVILILAILAVYFSESWLADVCIIYAMLSFVGVSVLTKVYMGVNAESKRRHQQKDGEKPV